MFVILDTNHYREFLHESAAGHRLRQRLMLADADAFTTIVTSQETTQGWAAEINRKKPSRSQIYAYRQFHDALDDFVEITILPFDEDAPAAFHRLQSLRLKGGTMDKKIAGVALSHDALLLSRNLVDFQDIPGLRVENWLD